MLLALLLLAQQPRTVTFTHPCAHSSVVLEALGKEMGVKMAPGGSVLQDYFALKFTDRPVEDVKRVIADTLNATWVERGDYCVLDRTAKDDKEEDDSELAALRNGIVKYMKENPTKVVSIEEIKGVLVRLTSVSAASSEYARLSQELQSLSPKSGFGARIIRALGVDRLLAVTEERPITYLFGHGSSSAMPPTVREVLTEYLNECSDVFEAARQLGADGYVREFEGASQRDGQYRLTIQRQDFMYSIVLNQLASEAPRGATNRPLGDAMIMRGAFASPSGKTLTLDPPKHMPVFSEDALAMMRVLYSKSYFPRPEVQPSEMQRLRVLAMAKDLRKYEPLCMYASAPLEQACQEQGKDYVALLSDHKAFDEDWIVQVPKGSASEMWRNWIAPLQVVEDEKSLILKIFSRNARYARERRLDRAAASELVRNYERRGWINLDDLAEFSKAAIDQQTFHFSLDSAFRFLPVKVRSVGEWAALRAYSGLSPNQRLAARESGILLEWRQLPAEFRAEVMPVLLSPSARFMASPSGVESNWSAMGKSGGELRQIGQLNGRTSVPAGTQVKIRVYTKAALKPGPSTKGGIDETALTPNEFSMRVRQDRSEYSPDFALAAVCYAERVQVDVFVPDTGYLYFAAQVDDVTDKTEFRPLDKLPEPWRTQLADAIKKNGGGRP